MVNKQAFYTGCCKKRIRTSLEEDPDVDAERGLEGLDPGVADGRVRRDVGLEGTLIGSRRC